VISLTLLCMLLVFMVKTLTGFYFKKRMLDAMEQDYKNSLDKDGLDHREYTL